MTIHRRTFLKRLGLGAAGLSLLPSVGFADVLNHGHLWRSSPEDQGVDSQGILDFIEAAGNSKHEFHSFMMARNGRVIAEGWWTPYRSTANHMLYSLSKSFTSTAVGLAVTEGHLTVNDTVTSFFPDKLPAQVSDHLAALRVKHLLTMSVGQSPEPKITLEHDWVKAFLAAPIPNEPGSVFLYNSTATYMLSAIVQKVTGQKVIDYLRPRLFEPLKIKDVTWETCPLGINTGGWGFAAPTEALAKFAQLYLQKGAWDSGQVIPAAWVNEATTFKIQQPPGAGQELEKQKLISEWHQGYCYQFWRCRHNAFRGDGAFGQYAIVMPDQNAVVAITCETSDMQGEINLVWDHLLPAMKEGLLPKNEATLGQLRHTSSNLALPLAAGDKPSPRNHDISGKTYRLESNELGLQSLKFSLHGDSLAATFRDRDEQSFPIQCGFGKWIDGQSSMPGIPPKLTVGDLHPVKIAGSAGWSEDETLQMMWRYYETPHHDEITCKFDGDNVTLTWMSSIAKRSSSHQDARPTLHGMIVS